MDVMFPRCAGLDVHQASITACVRVTPADGKPHAVTAVFGTLPTDLAALRDWLRGHDVKHVALEGTGVYWMPPYAVLEAAEFDLTLCNAHHVKNVPGRKTDQADAAWLAQLLAAGLLRKSFVPPAAIRELRELTRARTHRAEDRAHAAVVLHQLLERAGVKLASVVTDLQGKTARTILTAVVAGVTDAVALSAHACGRLRSKRAALAAVLGVAVPPGTRVLIGQALAQLDLFDAQITALDTEIAARVVPYRAQVDRLRTIGGIEAVAAAAILAETGVDMAVFATSGRIAAWAGLAPGTHESAGQRKRVGTRAGNPYLRRILVQTVITLSRLKRPHDLKDFLLAKRPRGFKKAAVATAHKLLVRIWRMLRDAVDYTPPAPVALSPRQKARRTQRLVERLGALGYDVQLEPHAA